MTQEIYRIDSDSSLLEELSNGIMNREVEQKYIYQGEGASLYYADKTSNPMYIGDSLTEKDFLDFWNKNLQNSKSTALISLGCGNSKTESYLYRNASMNNVSFYGIDASSSMLDLSIKNFQDIDCKKLFISSDFTSRKLRTELHDFTKNYKRRVFAFFSNTFGNIQHTNIIDILYNLLNQGDYIWLDVRLRKGSSVKDDLEIINLIAKDIDRTETYTSYLRTITDLGISHENGELSMKSMKVDSINALKCEFFFNLKVKSEILIKGDKVRILPGESIRLLRIYVYDKQGLINFFHEHGFKLIDKQIKGYRGQFLFEKE